MGIMGNRDIGAEDNDFLARMAAGKAFACAPEGTVEPSRETQGWCSAGKASIFRAKASNPRPKAGKTAAVLAGILVLAIVLASIVAQARGTSLPELIEGPGAAPETVEGTFAFASFGAELESEYVYSDAYFDAPASEYAPSLATLSCSLALATSSAAATPDTASANVTALLDELGFEDVRANDAYHAKPAPDSIGLAVGHKRLSASGRDVVAVAVRSGGYGAEWASNMEVGAGREHAGFAQARDQALKFLRSYLREGALDPDAYWVSGFSRGGAVAGLLAQSLVEAGADADAVYAYAFEPPASVRAGQASGATTGSAEASVRGAHVWNIVNRADLVPRMPLEQWGYRHPGVVRDLPSPGESGYVEAETAMRVRLASIDPEARYDVAAFEAKRVKANGSIVAAGERQTQAEFLDSLSAWIAGEGEKGLLDASVPSAETYAIELQDGLAYLAELLSAESVETAAQVQEDVWQDIRDNPLAFAKDGLSGVAGFGDYRELADSYARALDGAGVSYDRPRLDEAVKEVAGFLLGLAIGNPDGLATLLANAETLAEAHSMPVELAWMQSVDPVFATGAG